MEKRYKELTKEEKREYHNKKQREYVARNPVKWKKITSKTKRKRKIKYTDKHKGKYDYRGRYIDKQKKWREDNPNYYKEYFIEYFKEEKNRIKRNSRNKINNYLNYNKIKKQKNCSLCNSDKNIEKHHPDYNKPLEIIWLCRKCHRKLHRVNKQNL